MRLQNQRFMLAPAALLRAAPLLASLAFAALCLPAHAAWRCGEGAATTYSDRPCEGGRMLETPDQQDGTAARSAAARAASDKQRADRMARERQRQEAAEQSARARAEVGRQAHAKRCKQLEMKARWGAEDAASASVKHEARARRQARRKAEQYALECGDTAR